ncbi:MAG: methyltransferase domain-containing protein [Candidatus Aegiribacteria sp.]|nr:methyltransferase domain-containing protein [Candidatus Aegiribacteria sp.]MBD3294307.1 methyltransferase domain-containing protein [Candidatus Fermentibacteria bacterium]
MDPNKRKKQGEYVADYLLPLLERFQYRTPVADLGCGQGGILQSLAQHSRGPFIGIDFNEGSIHKAKNECPAELSIDFRTGDIRLIEGLEAGTILLCDVVEHMGAEIALDGAGRNLAPGGLVYVSFPPWRSPFGAHQQLSRNWVKNFPWIHLVLPKLTYSTSLKGTENSEDIHSVFRNRLTSRGFESLAEDRGWKVVYRQKYLVRPELTRKGLKVRKAPSLMPEFLTTGCEYLLKR